MPDGHSTEKNLQMHSSKMRGQIKGFGGDIGPLFLRYLQRKQKFAQKTIPARVTISGMVTMLRTVEISTVCTAYS